MEKRSDYVSINYKIGIPPQTNILEEKPGKVRY